MKNYKKRMLLLVGTILVFVVVFVSGWFASVSRQVLAQTRSLQNIDNPIARTLLAKFFPNPNLLVEDHVEISCEPEFSVKAFTASTLLNANFSVKDAKTGAVLFGPKLVDKIEPLWQKVWLGPLSSIPPKIHVVMDAQTPDGEPVSHKLIVEPDCKRPGSVITEKIVILWPKAKLLINPVPPFPPVPPRVPQPPLEPPEIPPFMTRLFDIPLTVAVPQEVVGQNLIATVIWRNPETGIGQYLGISELPDIPTEIISLSLTGVWPQALAPTNSFPASSFFDVFVELAVVEPNEEVGRLIADVMEKVGRDDVVTVEEPRRGSYLLSTFEEAYFFLSKADLNKDDAVDSRDIHLLSEVIRIVNATPLERHCPLDNDCDGLFNSTDNCSGAANPDQRDSDGNGIGDACDTCPADPTTNTCSITAGPQETTTGGGNSTTVVR